MSQQNDNGVPAPHADFLVAAIVVEGTLNVIRVIITPQYLNKGHKVIVVGDFVFHPNMQPIIFKSTVDVACGAAGRVAAGFMKPGKTVGINAEAIFSTVDLVIEAVRRKAASAIVGPDGKRVLPLGEHGVLQGSISEVLNLAVNGSPEIPKLQEGAPDGPAINEDPEGWAERPPEIVLDF